MDAIFIDNASKYKTHVKHHISADNNNFQSNILCCNYFIQYFIAIQVCQMIQPVQEDNKGGCLLEVYYYLGRNILI